MTLKLIKRALLSELREHLKKKEISLIIGPRQAGKTTLMLLLKEELDKNKEKTLFLSLDSEADMQYFSTQEALIRKIRLEIGEQGGYVFIDEIQRKENAGIFLKGIYDMGPFYKFIVSGSGSLELKEKIHESLMGRKKIFELNPVSFEEFFNFKTDYRYEKKLEDYFSLEKFKAEEFLNEYMQFGGYPKVVLENSLKEKKSSIDEIFRSYLEKDIIYLLNIERRDAFSMLVKILASQTGQILNYSEISSHAGLSFPTLKNYLWYAEKTFVIKILPPYFRNARKEIVKSPIVYFNDLGLRNYALGLFDRDINPKEKGFIFQNFIFNLLREKLQYSNISIHFWRTKDKAEVDFVLNTGKYVIPIEVKYKVLSQVELGRSLRSFIEKYKPPQALVVNLSYRHSIKLGNTKITFLPYWALLNEEFLI